MGSGNSIANKFFSDITTIDNFIDVTNPNICKKYEKEGDGVNQEEFSSLLKLKQGDEFNQGIFNIFETSSGKIPFKNFKGFYYMLKNNNKDTLEYKKKFVTNLLFNSQKEIPEEQYVENAIRYFKNEKMLRFLFGKKLKEKIKTTNKPQIYLKSEFLKNTDLIDECIFNDIHVREEINTSINNDPFNDDVLYICHCSERKKEEIDKPERDRKYNEAFNKMRRKFFGIESENRTFTIKLLENYFQEIGCEKIIIKIISRYLAKRTGNNFLNFDIFKDVFIKIAKTKNEEEQIDLILSFLSFPNKDGYFDKETISFLLKESTYVGELAKNQINKEELLFFLKNTSDPILLKLLDAISISIDKINILPFIKFDALPFEPFHFKNLKNYFLKNNTIEQVIKNCISEEEEFCVIDVDFKDKILNFIENNNSSENLPCIDISKLSDEKLCLKPGLVYQKDFFFIPKTIYDNYITQWFPKKGNDIILNKITYENEGNYEEDNFEENIIINKEGKIEEVEFYPITVKYITFKEIYATNKEIKAQINQDTLYRILEKNYRDNRAFLNNTLRFSRKTKLKNVFKAIEKTLDKKEYKKVKFHLYYNSKLSTDQINPNTTFEEQKITDYCLVLVNSLKTKDLINISYLQIFEWELEVLLPEDSIPCFTERTESNMGTSSRHFSRLSSLYIKRNSEPTIIGFNNLGNSCYLNSVLQILINMPYIKDFFISEKIKFFTKKTKKVDNKKLLIKYFLPILKERYRKENQNKNYENETNSLTPILFKNECGAINKIYDNLEQQDASEFLYFLLNQFHEDLNLNYKTNIIKKLEDNGEHQQQHQHQINSNLPDEKLSYLHWSDHIREAPSFINALFSMQMKSIIKCTHCNQTKVSFENSKGLFLPIHLSKKITLNIIIQKLPYNLKIYYDKISEPFKKFCDLNPQNSKLLNLELFENSKDEDEKDSAMNSPNFIKIEMLFNKASTIGNLIEIIKAYKPLELEPTSETKYISNTHNTFGIEKRSVMNYTTILCGMIKCFNINNFIILTNDMIIDECFQENQNVYLIEVLNSNGINEIQGISNENTKYILSNYILKEKHNKKFNDTIKSAIKEQYNHEQISTSKNIPLSIDKETTGSFDILTIDNYLSYYDEQESITHVEYRYEIEHIEYNIMIKHCFQNLYQNYYFDRYEMKNLFFPFDAIIVNNTENNFMGITLYDLIWKKYKRYIKEPMKTESKLWWRNNTQLKFCYPFVIKLCKMDEDKNYKCAKCLWFNFCKGCVVNPFKNNPLQIDLNTFIIVEWCKEVIEKEFMLNQIKTPFEIKLSKNDKINSDPELKIEDLFNEMTKKEIIENEIECDNCKAKRIFEKNIDFDIMPPVLILTLKRFKFSKMCEKKIETFIKFPLNDLNIKGCVYDLYGVVDHLGTPNSGHYTATVKIDNKWILFDDSQFEEIDESQVESRRAYILVYTLRKESWNGNGNKETKREREEKEEKEILIVNDNYNDIDNDNSQDNFKIEKVIKLNEFELEKKLEYSKSKNKKKICKDKGIYYNIMKSLFDNVVITDAENALKTKGHKYFYPNKIIGEPVCVMNEKNEEVKGYISNIKDEQIEVTTYEDVTSYPSNDVKLSVVLTVAKKIKAFYDLNDDTRDTKANNTESKQNSNTTNETSLENNSFCFVF